MMMVMMMVVIMLMIIMMMSRRKSRMAPGKRRWLKAVKLIKDRGDPWARFNLGSIKTEKGRRHRYNPLTQQWVVDECILKLDR